MKIYTITFHRANNYGAMLQAYALQKFLINNNYNTEILDYDNKNISNPYKLFTKLSKNPFRSVKNFIFDIISFKAKSQKITNFKKFREKLNCSKKFCVNDKDKFFLPGDILIVGSDQVWNPRWTGGIDDIYTLNIKNKSVKKISYAASSGGLEPLKKYEDEFKKRLNHFNAISVREDIMREYLNKVLSKKVTTVVDPTILLKKEDWKDIVGEERIIKERYIFTYEAGNPNKLYYDTINYLANKTGFKIVYFGKYDFKNNYKCNKKSCYSAGPREWMNLLYYSEFAITTSFHGVALSTVLNKDFYVVLSTLPERIKSLLNILDLKDRIVDSFESIDKVVNNQINWESVNKRLDNERIKSSKWLIESINGDKNE